MTKIKTVRKTKAEIIEAIRNEKDKVILKTSIFLVDEGIKNAILDAINRKVKVTLIYENLGHGKPCDELMEWCNKLNKNYFYLLQYKTKFYYTICLTTNVAIETTMGLISSSDTEVSGDKYYINTKDYEDELHEIISTIKRSDIKIGSSIDNIMKDLGFALEIPNYEGNIGTTEKSEPILSWLRTYEDPKIDRCSLVGVCLSMYGSFFTRGVVKGPMKGKTQFKINWETMSSDIKNEERLKEVGYIAYVCASKDDNKCRIAISPNIEFSDFQDNKGNMIRWGYVNIKDNILDTIDINTLSKDLQEEIYNNIISELNFFENKKK